MKPQSKPKNNDLLKRITNLPPTLDLLIAFPLAGYAGYVLHAGDGSRMFGFMAIAAAFCFAGLGINAVMRNMRELKVLEQYSQPGLITKLDEPKFERMLRALYTTRGYMIEEPGEHQEDPGYDFILSRAKERILVRTRDWVEDKVPLSTLKKVWNAKRPVKANGIIIVTNGVFAEDALEWGGRQNVEMLTGKDIEAAVLAEVSGGQDVKAGKASKKDAPARQPPTVPLPRTSPVAPIPPATPSGPPPPQFIFLDFATIEKGAGPLGDLLSKHPGFQIVATTGKERPLDDLKTQLSGYGDRLCGKTPDMPEYGASARYYEIVHYLANSQNGRNAKWIALDTQPNAFPEGCAELVLVSRAHGLDQQAINNIEGRMALVERRI